MMSFSRTPRLPGIHFEVQSQELEELLPRMDIPVFVGFAESGPLHCPVVVEDAVQFAEIFGGDVDLAWDGERRETVTAYLAPTVASFFRNGGIRCWIIRVADEREAACNWFPIPGFLQVTRDDGGSTAPPVPAFAPARSEGSWSDDLMVGASAVAQPQQIDSILPGPPMVLRLKRRASADVKTYDLLRLTSGDGNIIGFLPVIESILDSDGSPPTPELLAVECAEPIWFQRRLPAEFLLPFHPGELHASFYNQPNGSPLSSFQSSSKEILAEIEPASDEVGSPTYIVRIGASIADAPERGSYLRIEGSSGQLGYMVVRTIGVEGREGSATGDVLRIVGPGYSFLEEPVDVGEIESPTCERLSFALHVRGRNETIQRLEDLQFVPGSPRYWNDVPGDSGRYDIHFNDVMGVHTFPLAGDGPRKATLVPLDVGNVPEDYLSAVHPSNTAQVRDGLRSFGPHLFLDPDLVPCSVTGLVGQADYLRYTAVAPTEISPADDSMTLSREHLGPHVLRGIHAALGIDEATFIAVPDAIHLGWKEADPVIDIQQPIMTSPPSSSVGVPCASAECGGFVSCREDTLPPAPILSLVGRPPQKAGGHFTLAWSGSGELYVLGESRSPGLDDITQIYRGDDICIALYGRPTGVYYYRAKVLANGTYSIWSNIVVVRVPSEKRYDLVNAESYASESCLAIHRALVRMAAARGDMFAVLSMPREFREEEALKYVKLLKSPYGPTVDVECGAIDRPATAQSHPLRSGESSCWSFAAMYHPWCSPRKSSLVESLRAIPPDGPICGMLAKRAIARGAWVAPANEPLLDIVALSSELSKSGRLLFQASQLNAIIREPYGFVVLSADTLSDDARFRPVNVRRLVALLRRLALREGCRYVFEPNDEHLRRLVTREFEYQLGRMFSRGAFAGHVAAEAYQVVTGEGLNTASSVSQGRFVVELRVAPSSPLAFLIVRLVQTADHAYVSEGA
jgi:hypothetical protein